MTMLALTPFREMPLFQNRINRILDDFFTDGSPTLWEHSAPHLSPVVDIYDNESAIVIQADLPGMNKENITISLEERVLTLKGERTCENEVKEKSFYRKERSFGKFQRAFTLPESVDADKIKADFKEGVLKIEIPKPEEKKPKEIAIN